MSLTLPAPQTLVAPLNSLPLAAPNVATLADGGYLVVFDDAFMAFGSAELFAQRYDAAGAKVGGQFQVNTTTVLDESGGHTTALADGGFLVTFASAFDGEFTDIDSTFRAQRYDAVGKPVGAEVLLAPNDLESARGLPVGGLPGGGYVTAYGDFDGTRTTLMVQRYSADGSAMGEPLAAGAATTARDIAVLADGGYVTFVADTAGSGLFIQRFDASGAKVGAAIQTTAASFSGATGDGDISPLTNGGFVATWIASTPDLAGSFPRIQAQVFDAGGAKIGAEFQVNSTIGNTPLSPRVVGLADGSFVVAWTGEDGNGDGILARQFSATGAPLSAELVVNANIDGNQGAPTLTALAGDRVVVAWHDAESAAIQQRILQSDGLADNAAAIVQQTLTAGADTTPPLAADQLVRTTAVTLASNDSLTAGAGTDTLRLTAVGTLDLTAPGAFSGFERLEGSTGGDTFLVTQARLTGIGVIDAGAGFDVLRLKSAGTLDVAALTLKGVELIAGSAANDSLLGNGADNVFVGGGGADVIDGRGGLDTVSFLDAASSVTVNLAATKAQNTGGGGKDTLKNIENVTGSASADALTGSAGANVLKGGGGADRLIGAGGADTFAYDAAGDSTSFGRDLIADFNRAQGDRIDLSAIDAVTGGRDDAFVFVTTFTGAAGQLAVTAPGSGRYLAQADFNGDRAADLVIEVISPNALTASDFLL